MKNVKEWTYFEPKRPPPARPTFDKLNPRLIGMGGLEYIEDRVFKDTQEEEMETQNAINEATVAEVSKQPATPQRGRRESITPVVKRKFNIRVGSISPLNKSKIGKMKWEEFGTVKKLHPPPVQKGKGRRKSGF